MWLPVWSDISCCCVGKESDDRTEWRRWVAEWWTAICLRGRSGKEVLAVVGVDAARDSLRVWRRAVLCVSERRKNHRSSTPN